MDAVISKIHGMPLPTALAVGGSAVALAFLVSLLILKAYGNDHRTPSNLPPQIPGLPVVGNLLQLKEKKPHKTFAKWAEEYGSIYSIKTGATSMVVVNSIDLAKEAMVTRFPSISTRKVSRALAILTADKTMVAMSDYNDFHKTALKRILTNVLGPQAQKRNRVHRDTLIENTANQLHACVENSPQEAVNLRKHFLSELFGLALKQTLGQDVESVYVEDLGVTMSREDILNVLVHDPMHGAIEVDWRDFFPYLSWIPNKSFEFKIQLMDTRRKALMKSLIQEQKKRIASGQKINCYIDYLLEEEKSLSVKETVMLLWEPIIETSDTTLVATEWAMYELAKNPILQNRLYHEIQKVCGSEKITEEKLCQLPYLSAVFHETLRKHSPVPILPPRYVHENTELGGYHIPAGSELAINIYGCNMDKNVFENPEEWNPERFFQKNETLDLHKTISFGGGKRVCAGALQAMLIACTSIARLVQEFEWRLKDGEEENVDTLGLTTHKLHPMQAFIKVRK